ncbi:MAG: starch-binding protein [Candidatus Azobacteroides sp.]|nr:starch-binding protein [Candidatus Azobacteroides sp.]
MNRSFSFTKVIFSLLVCGLFLPGKLFSQTEAAPANYPGVMLQGFYWDSYSDTKWTNLTAQADELAASFDLIWLPPSARSTGGMGYLPIEYFNQNSPFGTAAELKTLISTLKNKGCKAMADIVINHRCGATGWCDVLSETYNGRSYIGGMASICNDDESKNNGCNPSGNNDTGEGYDAGRDIDHANPQVREMIKAYLGFMKNEMGFAGWRYDYAKGFAPQYFAEYNMAAGAEFSVAEYWDGSYDRVTGFIDGTISNGQIRSGAFDFPLKDQLQAAFGQGQYNALSWADQNNNNKPEPAGVIHQSGFRRFAYTFVDNHDTYGNEFYHINEPNVLAANAFILTQPGIPCVFLRHWIDHKSEIKKMIAARKAVGIHSQSTVNVLETAGDIYAAEVFGTTGSLVVKVGTRYAFTPPAGYELVTSGEKYAIWKKGGNEIGGPDPVKDITIKWKNSLEWPEMKLYTWDDNDQPTNGQWPGTVMTADGDGWYSYTFQNVSSAKFLFTSGDGTAPQPQTVDISTTSDACYEILSTTDTQGHNNVGTVTCGGGTTNPFTIKWKNDQGWSSMNLYAWDSNGTLLEGWPGTVMTPDGDGWYSYTFNTAPVNVIFNDGTNQTMDITGVSSDKCYSINAETTTNSGGTTVNTVSELTDCSGGTVEPTSFTVRWKDDQNWGTMYLYAWEMGGAPDLLGEWPGMQVFPDGSGWYSYTFENVSPLGIIFNQGEGGSQTVNMEYVSADVCYQINPETVAGNFENTVHTTDPILCSPTQIKEATNAGIVIYPNPATDFLHIGNADGIEQVVIRNIAGATVSQSVAISGTVNVKNLSPGVYFMDIKTKSGRETVKFVKK